jgi:hypothetical protein
MLRCVALVRTEVSEDFISSIIRVTRIGELGTTLAESSNRSTLGKCWHQLCEKGNLTYEVHKSLVGVRDKKTIRYGELEAGKPLEPLTGTSGPLVRKGNILTERPPLVGEI